MADEQVPREIGIIVHRCGALKTLVGIKMDEIAQHATLQDGRAVDHVRGEIHDIVDRFCDDYVALQVLMRKHFGIDP